MIGASLALAGTAWGQANATHTHMAESNSEVVVYVRLTNGDPLNTPARVKLLTSNGMPLMETTTQTRGEVVFAGLALGDYYIEVNANGYQLAREEVSLPIPVRTQVHIYLRPEASSGPPSTPLAAPVLAPKAQKEVENGLEALRQGNLKEAQARLEHASKLAPSHPDPLYLLGVLYIRQNDLPRARTVLEKATQLYPNHTRAVAALGTVLSNQGDYAAAIPILEKAVTLNDKAYETHWTVAKAYYQEKKYDLAREHAQQALTLSQGKAPEIQLLLAQSLAATGHRDKAAAELQAFLREHPEHAKAATARRWLEQLGQGKASAPK